MREDDLLIITADHGCDPITPSTDHSREYVPVLICGSKVSASDLGTKDGFGFVSETVESYLNS
jgi:phosphopentomutase